MVRVGLLAGLLVVAMGSGAVAQEPSPEVSPSLAPDEPELTLPSAVGEYELTLMEGSVAETLAITPEQREFWRQVLLPFDKGLDDGQFASSAAYTASGDIVVGLFALRVAGVPAESLTEPFLGAILGWGEDLEDLPEFTLEWMDVDGHRIQAFTGDDYPFPSYLYPAGEVVYFIGIASDDLLIEDVLAELP